MDVTMTTPEGQVIVGRVCRAKRRFDPTHFLIESDQIKGLESTEFLLGFEKGDLFEILEKNKIIDDDEGFRRPPHWIGVRAIKTDKVGFVPANYVTIEEQEEIDAIKSSQDFYVLALEELKQRPEFQQTADKNILNIMIPEPDYSDCEEDENPTETTTTTTTMMSPHTNRQQQQHSTNNGHSTEDHIIVPRKLANPCADSKEKQNLHRELLFNQKIGKNVLGQKSELKKAMDKFQEDQKKKELESEKLSNRTSLERKLEEQANKIKMLEEQVIQEKSSEDSSSTSPSQSEFHRVHAKVRARVDTQ